MKNINLFALLATFTFIFSSCSTNEVLSSEEQSLDLLKTYTIQRDVNKAYSLVYDLYDDTQTEVVVDKLTNTNNIYLYASDKESSRKVTQNLMINENQFTVGFIDTNTDKKTQITITDDDLSLRKKSETRKLDSYSISANQNGLYTLDFSVSPGVRVDFVFNEELKTYEIHLEEGKSSEREYSRVLEKVDGQALKFDFVNHNETTLQGKPNEPDGLGSNRRPRGIIL